MNVYKLGKGQNMKKNAIRALCAGLLLTSPNAFSGIIVSDFSSGNEGWRLSGDATTNSVQYSSSGGFAYGVDGAKGSLWYFEAPSKFKGNQSAAFGHNLEFEMNYTGSGSTLSGGSMVTLWATDGTSLLINSSAPASRGSWYKYTFNLSDSDNWLYQGVKATNENIRYVLTNLSRLRIRGEFVHGSDTGRLDNVKLFAVPEPNALFSFGIGLLGMMAWNRRKLK